MCPAQERTGNAWPARTGKREDMDIVRIRYSFVGRVQGVGFRYTAYYLAKQLGLTGYVRNESDGSVTMEVQGNPYDVKSMLQKIRESRWIRIDSANPRRIPAVPDERSFRVESGGNY